jgi:hypothetical protein
MKINLNTSSHLIAFAAIVWGVFLDVESAQAAEFLYKPMTTIPGLTGTGDIVEFINSAYTVLIAVGGIFGVLKIAYSGVVYTMSDMVSTKSEAIHDIQGVIKGIAVLLIPFIVLNTIYSPLTNLNVLQNLQEFEKVEKPDTSLAGQEARIEGYRQDAAPGLVSLARTCLNAGGTLVNDYEPGTEIAFTGAGVGHHGTRCVPKETVVSDEDCTLGAEGYSFDCYKAEYTFTECKDSASACRDKCSGSDETYSETTTSDMSGNITTQRFCRHRTSL